MASSDPTYTPGTPGVSQEAQIMLNSFWTNTLEEIKNLTPVSTVKTLYSVGNNRKLFFLFYLTISFTWQ